MPRSRKPTKAKRVDQLELAFSEYFCGSYKNGGKALKFKHRTSDVTAVRWTGTPESEMEIKSLGALIELQPDTGHLFVGTDDGVALAPIGWWVVNTEGRISVWDHVEFRNEFVEVWEV